MGKKVAVFGSFIVDLSGRAEHLPKAGETVIGSSFIMGPGEKALTKLLRQKGREQMPA